MAEINQPQQPAKHEPQHEPQVPETFLISEDDFYEKLKKQKPFTENIHPLKLKLDDTERKNAAKAYGLPDDASWYDIYQRQKQIESKME